MSDTDHPDRNRRKLYGRRKGPKMSERQVGLRSGLLQELAYVPGGDPLAQFPDSVARSGWRSVSAPASIWWRWPGTIPMSA